ncbi:hypothetical protein RYZ26_19535 [Terasakiella sp. A23]|uniref:hypothetical protein n=1 Tax=Terasakiella sp. FCG-A23 TaxID=3080561 RepID=UPI002954069F|nr:hypothetical protein [Terasakiella sp. A23]MDV7341802.1 hypothetical protein [Terasakiella sp. A23]
MSTPEINRIEKVSNLLVTCHSILSSRYLRRAFLLNLISTLFSAVLAILIFAPQELLSKINPTGFDNTMFMGCLAAVLFLLSLVEMKVAWKEKGSFHKDAANAYSRVKLEIRASYRDGKIDDAKMQDISTKYSLIGEMHPPVPDDQFVKLKKKHKLKIEVSKYLDKNPAANIFLVHIKLWIRDNCKWL